MFPTLESNDIVLVQKKKYVLGKRSVVIFFHDIDKSYLSKRIFAIPNDTILFHLGRGKDDDDDDCTINSFDISKSNSIDSMLIMENTFYYVIGDNFKESLDSRHFGPVPEENIIGKAVLVLFNYRDGKFRWDRFLKKIE